MTRCTATHPDGSTSEVRGGTGTERRVQGTSYVEVGEFDGVPGPTTVDCSFDEEANLFGSVNAAPFMVHTYYPRARIVGLLLVLAGVGLIGAGTGLIVWGARRRRLA